VSELALRSHVRRQATGAAGLSHEPWARIRIRIGGQQIVPRFQFLEDALTPERLGFSEEALSRRTPDGFEDRYLLTAPTRSASLRPISKLPIDTRERLASNECGNCSCSKRYATMARGLALPNAADSPQQTATLPSFRVLDPIPWPLRSSPVRSRPIAFGAMADEGFLRGRHRDGSVESQSGTAAAIPAEVCARAAPGLGHAISRIAQSCRGERTERDQRCRDQGHDMARGRENLFRLVSEP